jgi:hypothetical protein
LYFVIAALWDRFRQLDWAAITVHYHFFVVALAAASGSRAVTGFLLGTVLKHLSYPLPYRWVMAVAWVAAVGKYVPGKLATLAGGVYLLGQHDVRPSVSTAALTLCNGLAVTVGLLVALPLMFSDEVTQILPLSRLWFSSLLLIGLIAIWPKVFFSVGNFILRRMGRAHIETTLTLRQMLPLIGLVVGQCLVGGVTTWCVARAISDVTAATIPVMVSITALAGAAGLLALFAPAGLGVREGVYLLALRPVIGSEAAALVAVGMRLLQTVADALMGVLGALILRRSPQRHP